MNCPNCGKETNKITTVADDEGNPFSFCQLCPRPQKKELNFPNIITSSKREMVHKYKRKNRKNENDDKFKQFTLSEEEIKQTQAMRPSVRIVDTPDTRKRDARDRQRETVFVELNGRNTGNRNTIVRNKLSSKFGHENYKIIRDDGFKVIAESNYTNANNIGTIN